MQLEALTAFAVIATLLCLFSLNVQAPANEQSDATVVSCSLPAECAELQKTQSPQWPVSLPQWGPTSSIPGLQTPGFRVSRVEPLSI